MIDIRVLILSDDPPAGPIVFLAAVSEKQAKVWQVPNLGAPSSAGSAKSFEIHQQNSASRSQQEVDSGLAKFLTSKSNCVAKLQLSDSSYAARANIVQMRQPDESCLVSYLASGNIVVHSLPKLRPLLDADFVPLSSPLISSSLRMSRNGHCLYQPSVGEICKFTLSAHYRSLVNEMTGALYVPRDMPEMARANFFKSLFSVTSSAAARQSNRDELFGECSAGKASRGVATHIAGMEKLKSAAAGTLGHEMRMAREGLDERGEKLSEIEDKTLQMMNQSESYAQAAHKLAEKFKDKKWYQF